MNEGLRRAEAALQREEPVDAGGRTHGIRLQADVRFGHQRWPERQLCEVQLTSGCGYAVSRLRRLLPCRANWQYPLLPFAVAAGSAAALREEPLAAGSDLVDGSIQHRVGQPGVRLRTDRPDYDHAIEAIERGRQIAELTDVQADALAQLDVERHSSKPVLV